MKKMTEDNVKAALAGESQAHVKYAAFAGRPKRRTCPTSPASSRPIPTPSRSTPPITSRSWAPSARPRTTSTAAVGGETFEIEEMYPAFIVTAQSPGRESRRDVLQRRPGRREGPRRPLQGRPRGRRRGPGPRLQAIHVCAVCGFTMEGDAPDKCPVCGAPKDKFVRSEDGPGEAHMAIDKNLAAWQILGVAIRSEIDAAAFYAGSRDGSRTSSSSRSSSSWPSKRSSTGRSSSACSARGTRTSRRTSPSRR